MNYLAPNFYPSFILRIEWKAAGGHSVYCDGKIGVISVHSSFAEAEDLGD